MFGNNGGFYNGGYLPDGTYISPGMARMGYGGYGGNVPMMNTNNPNMIMQNQNQQQQQQKMPILKGRIVTNVEEVKGILIEPDGSTYFFPCPAENCIYTKTIDLNAQSVINVYRLSNNSLPVYADMQTVNGLNERISTLEQMLFSQQQKGGIKNDDEQSNATNVQHVSANAK